MRLGIERVQSAIPRVAEVPLGGTATGTGINTPLGFPQRVIAVLATDSGLPITEALDHFEARGARDGLVEASGALRVIAVSLTKICNDLRWMGSGPVSYTHLDVYKRQGARSGSRVPRPGSTRHEPQRPTDRGRQAARDRR